MLLRIIDIDEGDVIGVIEIPDYLANQVANVLREEGLRADVIENNTITHIASIEELQKWLDK